MLTVPRPPYLVLVGRVAFAAIFIVSFAGHFKAGTIAYAAAAGVPLAGLLVPVAGIVGLLGGLSVLLGFHARVGAWLLIVFLVPVTISLHAFWAVADPMGRQIQMAMFFKNVSILGGALLIAHFGAGPVSLDERAGRR